MTFFKPGNANGIIMNQGGKGQEFNLNFLLQPPLCSPAPETSTKIAKKQTKPWKKPRDMPDSKSNTSS